MTLGLSNVREVEEKGIYEMSNQPTVKPEDRAAAIAYLNVIAGFRGADAITEIREDHAAVLAMAAHREAAEAPLVAAMEFFQANRSTSRGLMLASERVRRALEKVTA